MTTTMTVIDAIQEIPVPMPGTLMSQTPTVEQEVAAAIKAHEAGKPFGLLLYQASKPAQERLCKIVNSRQQPNMPSRLNPPALNWVWDDVSNTDKGGYYWPPDRVYRSANEYDRD